MSYSVDTMMPARVPWGHAWAPEDPTKTIGVADMGITLLILQCMVISEESPQRSLEAGITKQWQLSSPKFGGQLRKSRTRLISRAPRRWRPATPSPYERIFLASMNVQCSLTFKILGTSSQIFPAAFLLWGIFEKQVFSERQTQRV